MYRSNFWTLIGYSAWLLLPFTGYYLLSFFPAQNPIIIILGILCSVLEFLITFWTGIILILLVNAIAENHPFDAEGVKKYSIGLLQPTARVFLLHIVLVLAGFVLLIIPGFIALVWFAFAQTAAVLDGKRSMDALKFSRFLSKDRFLDVLYRLIAGPIMIGFVYSIVVAIIISVAGASSGLDPVNITAQNELPAWLDLLQSIVEIFTIPLLATYMTLLYKHLRGTGLMVEKQANNTQEPKDPVELPETPPVETPET